MRQSFKNSYKIERHETVSLSVYNVGFQQCDPLYKWGTGVRDHYLIHHIIAGKGYYSVAGKIFELTAGQTFLIYPDVEVSYWADRESPWEYYWVGFSGSDASVLIGNTDFTRDNPVISTPFNDELKDAFLDIYNSRGNSEASIVRMTGYLYIALSTIIEHSSDIKATNTSFAYAQKAVDFITCNYSRQIGVTDISDYVGISRSHLYRIFMENLLVSPADFLTEFRIKQACHLFKHTSLSIGAIANSVGFSDSLYFSKVFHKHKGISPSEYIKKQSKKPPVE